MAVEVRFGNLDIDELERTLGIVFTEEDRNLLKETRQEQIMDGNKVLKMPSRSWHFFDIPRVLELGSHSFFVELQELFSRYEIKGQLEVSFRFADDEKIENLYMLENTDGYPNYLYGHRISKLGYGYFQFWQIYKINKRTIEYREVRAETFFGDKKGLNGYVINDFLVPCEDDFKVSSLKIKKEELDNFESEIVTFTYADILALKPWKGEQVKYLNSTKNFDWEEYLKKEKSYRKRARNLGK